MKKVLALNEKQSCNQYFCSSLESYVFDWNCIFSFLLSMHLRILGSLFLSDISSILSGSLASLITFMQYFLLSCTKSDSFYLQKLVFLMFCVTKEWFRALFAAEQCLNHLKKSSTQQFDDKVHSITLWSKYAKGNQVTVVLEWFVWG